MSKRVDITGCKFNRLFVIEMILVEKGPSRCKCKCDCGNIHIVKACLLKNNSVRSCGCYQKDKAKQIVIAYKEKNKVGEISRSFFTAIKWNAKVRNIPFEVTVEYIWQLYLKQEGKCAITKLDIFFGDRDSYEWTCSLDRINSKGSYTEDNIRWVHKIVNKMKNNMSDYEFINWCKLVSVNN